MRHQASPSFWRHFDQLPAAVQRTARKNFDLLKHDPNHPSLRFKPTGKYWSVRVGAAHRALAVRTADRCVWFWIGHHDAYERRIDE